MGVWKVLWEKYVWVVFAWRTAGSLNFSKKKPVAGFKLSVHTHTI
jgi:hypothetical protein